MWGYVIGGLFLLGWGFWAGEDSERKKQSQKTKKKKTSKRVHDEPSGTDGSTGTGNVPEYCTPPSAPRLDDI